MLKWHDDVIKWEHFPRYWPFVRGIHRSPVNSPHKGQWRGALMFSLICARINAWVNNSGAGDLRRNHAHYDVTVMDHTHLNRMVSPVCCVTSTVGKFVNIMGRKTPFQYEDHHSRYRESYDKDKAIVKLSYYSRVNIYTCEIDLYNEKVSISPIAVNSKQKNTVQLVMALWRHIMTYTALGQYLLR